MLTSVGMRRICMGPWQPSIWASSLKMSWAREATTGSEERKQASKSKHKRGKKKKDRLSSLQLVLCTIVIFEENGNGEGADLVLGTDGEGGVNCADNAQGLHDEGEHL